MPERVITSVLLIVTLANAAMLITGLIASRKKKDFRKVPASDDSCSEKTYWQKPDDSPIECSQKKDYIKLLKDFSKISDSGVKEDPISSILVSRRTENDREFMKKADEVLLRNVSDSSYSVDRFCQDMHRERSGVFRHISRITGMTPSRYMEHCRVAMAMKLLRADISISDESLAEKSGFKSCRAMNGAFSANLGMSPEEYRNILSNKADNPGLFP